MSLHKYAFTLKTLAIAQFAIGLVQDAIQPIDCVSSLTATEVPWNQDIKKPAERFCLAVVEFHRCKRAIIALTEFPKDSVFLPSKARYFYAL